ncbi:MAG: MFS transporter [Spirochaetes bacterium]|nr:MFS transporter [Spirochaetota bacterium]
MRFFRQLASEYKEAFVSFSKNARLFLLGNFMLGIGNNLVQLLLNLYMKNLGIGENDIGTVLAMRALGSFLIALPASFIVARLNSRLLLMGATVLTASAFAAQGLFTAFGPLASSVFLSGAFSSMYQVAAGPFFMKNSGEKERIHLFSLNGALGMGTGVLGSLFGGLFKEAVFSFTGNEALAYRLALALGGAFVLVAIIPFSGIKDGDANPGQLNGSPAPKQRVPLGKINVWLYVKLLLPGFFVGMGAGLTVPYLNLYFKNEFNLGDSLIGVIFAAGQVVTFLGMVSGPPIAKRLGKERAIFWTQAISVPFILVLTYLRWLPLVLLAFLMRQALMNMSSPISENFTLEQIPPQQQHFMNACKMLNWTGSWMVSAKISGWLIATRGFAPSFTLTALLYTLSSVLFWLFFLNRRKAVSAKR